MQIESMDKKAQISCFGSFDNQHAESTLRIADSKCPNIIKSRVFRFEYFANGKKKAFSVDLHNSQIIAVN